MFKLIAVAAALAVVTGVAGAQSATTKAKSSVQTGVKTTSVRKQSMAKKSESQASLRAEAKVSLATARATALKEVPNGKVKSSELERENGKLIYSFDIAVAGKSGIEEVNVNAIDGSIVAHEHETPKSEKKEAAAEAKEKATKK